MISVGNCGLGKGPFLQYRQIKTIWEQWNTSKVSYVMPEIILKPNHIISSESVGGSIRPRNKEII